MAARGSEAKIKITETILETFTGAFQHEKEIRIPYMENGELLEIKCVLTCAKTNVGQQLSLDASTTTGSSIDLTSEGEKNIEMTQEELDRVDSLYELLQKGM